MARIRWTLLLVAVSTVFVAACSGSDDDAGQGSLNARAAGGPEESGGGARGSAAARGPSDLPAVGPSIIKTADLHLEVESAGFRDAFQSVVTIAEGKGGFVLSSQEGSGAERTGTITLRVPADDFGAALSEIEALGAVAHRSISGEDVSQEFVDLEARLRNLRAQESVLLRLMDRAQTIGHTIRVQNELTTVQLDIERARGRLRYLEDRTSFSTITVHLKEAGAGAGDDPAVVERAWQVARDTTGLIVSAVLIGGAALAPVALLLLVVLLGFRWVRPRLGRATGP